MPGELQLGRGRWTLLLLWLLLAFTVLVDATLESTEVPSDDVCALDSSSEAARQGCSQLQADFTRTVAPANTEPESEGLREEGPSPPSGQADISTGGSATHSSLASASSVPQASQRDAANSNLAEMKKNRQAASRTRRTSLLYVSPWTWVALATLIFIPLCVGVAFLFRGRGSTGDSADGSDEAVQDTMTYQIGGLTTWEVFRGYPCTVWDNETLWLQMRRLLGVALLVAITEFMVVPDPIGIDPTLFDSVGTMLNVFVGLLLSFFLTSNVNRWIQIVNGFLDLFNSTRNLQLVMTAFGAKKENADRVLRYCVLSGHLVTQDLKMSAKPRNEREQLVAAMWADLEQKETKYSKLLPEERKQLEMTKDPSGMCWTWVVSMLGRMSQDGELPPFPAGTFGMVLTNACNAKKGMDGLRDCIKVQMPFVYVHTVATIVQLNNILSAVSLGLTLGATLGVTLARLNSTLKIYSEPLTHEQRPVMEDIQEVLVQLFRCFVAPVLYQAFFEIGVSIASPFYSDDGAIPAERLLANLERDLENSSDKAESPPGWQAPSMKK